MGILILEKDPFAQAVETQTAEMSYRNVNVRRPLEGLALKAPRHAFISVNQLNGTGNLVPISLYDSSAPGGKSNANHNFLLQSVKFSRQEKVQIVETFGPHFTFFFGERPIVVACIGMLINSRDFNWRNEWIRNYDQFLRGTKAVENRARVYLGFDDLLLEGFILMTDVDQNSEIPFLAPFSFQMLLTNYVDLSIQTGQVSIDSEENQAGLFSSGFYNYVDSYEKTRRSGAFGLAGSMPEYLFPALQEDNYEIDPLTGESRKASGSTGDVPADVDGSTDPRSASWVSGRSPGQKQWKNPDEALTNLASNLSAQETGTDPLTVRRSIRNNPGSFSLTSRNQVTQSISASLGTGVANSVLVVPESPTITSSRSLI